MNWIQSSHNPDYYGYRWGDYNCHINVCYDGAIVAEIHIGGSPIAWDNEGRYPPHGSVLIKTFNSLEEAQEGVRHRLIEHCVHQQRLYRKFENELAD